MDDEVRGNRTLLFPLMKCNACMYVCMYVLEMNDAAGQSGSNIRTQTASIFYLIRCLDERHACKSHHMLAPSFS